MSSSTSSHVSPSKHTLRQLKLIVPGSIITYYFGTISELWRLVHDDDSWGHTAASGGLVLGCLTVLLFLWVLLTPWLRGVEPDFRSWRQSGVLSSVIPTLTSTIVLGWLLLVVTFGQYSNLGYLKGIVGVSAVYMLIFGLLGLIPAPKSMYSGNNPFASQASAHTRYPELSSDPSSAHFTSWIQGQQSTEYQQSPQQSLSPQFSPVSPPFTSPLQSPPFQPSSFFGQQLAAASGQLGTSYGYLQGQTTSAPQSYNPVQQQLNNPAYVSQFDPYSSVSQGWDASTTQTQQPTQQTGATSTAGTAPHNSHLHPREYLRTHKQEVDSWDAYAWKQLLNSFDALKDAWITRKREIEAQVTQLQLQMQYGGGHYAPQIQQEGARLQSLIKEAESNSDSVAASSFQMQEVFSSYRQSGDLASKRRVREASNGALLALPDWPSQQY